ncbi:MAG: hypothetical protein KC442_10560 [Thermomicrobiales bacterium]|nr:hypothetical protein [Thermomicrobiales bacterium]
MNRAEAAAYIGERFGAYLNAVGRTAADSSGNLKPAIDDALRALGFADADLPTGETSGAEADEDLRVQLPYRTLGQVCRDLGATYFDVTVGDSFRLSQVRTACWKDLEAAEAAVLARFGTTGVVDGDGASSGLITVDTNTLGWTEAC